MSTSRSRGIEINAKQQAGNGVGRCLCLYLAGEKQVAINKMRNNGHAISKILNQTKTNKIKSNLLKGILLNKYYGWIFLFSIYSRVLTRFSSPQNVPTDSL
jgi:hypothetical protein